MEDIMNILKPLEEWGLLIKGISKLIKNETKEQKGGFLSLLLGTLAAKILGNALAGKSKNRSRWGSNKSKRKLLMSTHPLSNFEIQKCYQKEPKFNGVYARNKLSKIKDGAYIINLDEYESIGTHWIALYMNAENVTYFDSFGVEHVPKEI